MVFANVAEVHRAYENRAVDLHAKIKVRIREAVIDEQKTRAARRPRIVDTTVGRALLAEILPKGLPFALDQHRADQEGDLAPDQRVLSPAGSEGHRRVRRPADVHGLPLRDARRCLDRHRRHEDPGARRQAILDGAEKEVKEIQEQYRFGSRHQRRALQQGRRHLVAHERPGRRRR